MPICHSSASGDNKKFGRKRDPLEKVMKTTMTDHVIGKNKKREKRRYHLCLLKIFM
jgi:hypothetical protein